MLDPKSLSFKKAKSDSEITAIYNYNVKAFAETQDFLWSTDSIKKDMTEGWSVYSVLLDDEVVAAVFTKDMKGSLHTKNTPIKLDYQGNGFSHRIKDFLEGEAKKIGAKKIVNYCPKDNFRLISLNETHGYTSTGNYLGKNKTIMEWEKILK